MHPNAHTNVVQTVVPQGLCSGCGVCAAMCPVGVLTIELSEGFYRPRLTGDCLAGCGLCLRVCPFSGDGVTRQALTHDAFGEQAGISWRSESGWFRQAYVGYSAEGAQRQRGASGGMATWLLDRLLTNHDVDRVVAVGAAPEPCEALFQFQTYSDTERLALAAGSKYYPVEISSALRSIWTEPEEHRYAIVGLPCVLNGVRRAMRENHRLARRIRYLLGLVCNHCPGVGYTEFLCALAGISTDQVSTVQYRLSGEDRADNFRFRALLTNGEWSSPVSFRGLASRVWNKQYFAYGACSYCDDVFAEAADAVFMDAWLEPYKEDTRGTSIVVVRNELLHDIVESGRSEGACQLSPCSADDIVASQQSLVRRKKVDVRHRLLARQQRGQVLPPPDVEPAVELVAGALRQARQEERRVAWSPRLWKAFRGLPPGLIPVYCWLVERLSGEPLAVSPLRRLARLGGRLLRWIGLYPLWRRVKSRWLR